MGSTMDVLARWRTTHQALFTFAQSTKHVGLYQKFGFYPRFLTAIMEKKVSASSSRRTGTATVATFSSLGGKGERKEVLKECVELTGDVLRGLDLSDEIRTAHNLSLGDTVLLRDGSPTEGFAVCHSGRNTEGGTGTCYVKFGLVAGGSGAKARFRRLLAACESFASQNGAETVEAGVNLGRTEAYREMQTNGFRTEFQGIVMQRPNEPGYNRPEVFAIDDLR